MFKHLRGFSGHYSPWLLVEITRGERGIVFSLLWGGSSACSLGSLAGSLSSPAGSLDLLAGSLGSNTVSLGSYVG